MLLCLVGEIDGRDGGVDGLGLGTRRVKRRFARIAMGGLTGLFAALCLAEFASAAARGRLRATVGASVMLRSTVMCG